MSKTATAETVGKRLRRLREAVGMSQRMLVQETRYTAAYVSRIEADERQPSVTTIRALAARLGVDPHYLETGRTAVTIHADTCEIDEAAERFGAELRWDDLTPQEQGYIQTGLDHALAESLAIRLHAAGLRRRLETS